MPWLSYASMPLAGYISKRLLCCPMNSAMPSGRPSGAGEPLITGDERLYNAVKGKLDFVLYIADFQA